MATALNLGSNLTIMELFRREDPDGTLAQIVDVLAQENRILEDITWIECNNGTSHEDTITASEPTGAERTYDEGVSKEAGVTEKLTEPTCMLNGLSEVDAKKIQHSAGGEGATRLQEDGFFLRGMTKTFVSRLFDGSRTTDIRRINGINTRTNYNTLQTAGSETRVFNNVPQGSTASSSSNKTSIYFVQWGHKMVDCIYPRHGVHGDGILPIKMKDFGLSIINQVSTSETKKYPAWQTWFENDFGLFIHDPRCIKRVCNISTTAIDGVDDWSFNEEALIDAYSQLEYNGAGVKMYCNRTVFAQAWKRSNEKGNAFFTESKGEGPFAHPVVYWNGIELKRVDQIGNDQAVVTT